MKEISDYKFSSNSWQLRELGFISGNKYKVVKEFKSVKSGDIIIFIGFEDTDNHFGRFVFKNEKGQLFEISGDFCSNKHHLFVEIKNNIVEA